jgi:hypothetical protein
VVSKDDDFDARYSPTWAVVRLLSPDRDAGRTALHLRLETNRPSRKGGEWVSPLRVTGEGPRVGAGAVTCNAERWPAAFGHGAVDADHDRDDAHAVTRNGCVPTAERPPAMSAGTAPGGADSQTAPRIGSPLAIHWPARRGRQIRGNQCRSPAPGKSARPASRQSDAAQPPQAPAPCHHRPEAFPGRRT